MTEAPQDREALAAELAELEGKVRDLSRDWPAPILNRMQRRIKELREELSR